MRFAKLEGLGNDYLFTEGAPKNPSRAATLLCDRHYGVGADGLVLIAPPDYPEADIKIRIFNPDGSEAETCGNALRCLGKYLYDRGKITKQKIIVQTKHDYITANLMVRDGRVYRVKVDLGVPRLTKKELGIQHNFSDENEQVINEKLFLQDHNSFEFTSVSLGNLHCVIWVEDLENFPVTKYGPMIEKYSLFPNRTNVEFVQLVDDNLVKQRTWERGVGETLACGTGAAAAVVSGVILGKIARKCKVQLTGGFLEVYWSIKNNHIYITGPCKDIFDGEIHIL